MAKDSVRTIARDLVNEIYNTDKFDRLKDFLKFGRNNTIALSTRGMSGMGEWNEGNYLGRLFYTKDYQQGPTDKANRFFPEPSYEITTSENICYEGCLLSTQWESKYDINGGGSHNLVLPALIETARHYYPTIDVLQYEHRLNNASGFNSSNKVVKDIGVMDASTDKDISLIIEGYLNGSDKQIVLTGAPGTGKTYSIRKYMLESGYYEGEQYKFVQFHGSYDYTDFVEGLRPVMIGENETPTFVRIDGSFKSFCRKVMENNLSELGQKIGIGEMDTKTKAELLENLYIAKKKNESHRSDSEIRLVNEWNTIIEDEPFYFVIDEINRADLSKVFGELMFAMEEDYRGVENRFDTQYMNLATYSVVEGTAEIIPFDCFKNGFFIPENLYLIGTMNDIDRSVESFDFALRRRFKWVDIKANEVMRISLKSMLSERGRKIDNATIDNYINRVISMNNLIANAEEFLLNDAFCIGPAYFKNYNGTNEEDIWREKIEPIIREYCRGRKPKDVDSFVLKCKSIYEGENRPKEESDIEVSVIEEGVDNE